MATDKSEPRVGLIIKVGLISVLTVGAVRIALASYFDQVTQAETQRKVALAKPEALMELRTDEHARLMTGPKPLELAMEELAKKGRMGASPEIVPTASRDLAPLQGWTKMPGTVPAAMAAAAAAPTAQPEAPAAAADAGAPGAAPQDAGAGNAPAPKNAPETGPGKRKP
jgi:hypothetical protein